MFKMKHMAVAAALAVSAVVATGADLNVTHDLGSGPFFLFVGKAAGSFVDTFTFNLTTPPSWIASFTIDELVLQPYTNINWDNTAAATLSGGGLPAPIVIGESGPDSTYSFNNLTVTGPVTLTLRGTATGNGIPGVISPGTYSIAAVAAPIPEPETYMMMLAGLAAVGFVGMRRRQRG